MTAVDMNRPRNQTFPVKGKVHVVFKSWLEETLYCRLPSRPCGSHEGDLVLEVAYCQAAKSRDLTEVQVRQAIQVMLDAGLLERYGRKGEHYLRKAKGERALSLQFI